MPISTTPSSVLFNTLYVRWWSCSVAKGKALLTLVAAEVWGHFNVAVHYVLSESSLGKYISGWMLCLTTFWIFNGSQIVKLHFQSFFHYQKSCIISDCATSPAMSNTVNILLLF